MVETLTVYLVYTLLWSFGKEVNDRKLSGESQTSSAKSLIVFLKESMFQRNCVTRNEWCLTQFHNQFNLLVFIFFLIFHFNLMILRSRKLLSNSIYNNLILLFMLFVCKTLLDIIINIIIKIIASCISSFIIL